ncbi:MAG TPA: protein kinase [Candidatus Limnocylindria bacterium]|nr:protein kinase [Candidatus Limnocylindria bacterium]
MPTEGSLRASDGSAKARAARRLGGRYLLTERIDAGGAGEVWRARDERLDREVAVKILGAGADEAFRERFADEARRAASVAHPNVVTVFDEGRDGAESFMVMEYVRGKTLRDIVAERGPLPAHEAARIVSQIAAALDAAHEAGVIHCDVKPANVIVDEHGRAKLTDFGIARAARGPREHELIGTARYIAPERVAGEAPTERSDIYSLGLVAYELFAGRPAYADLETEDLLRQRLEGPPPSLRGARVGVSDAVDRVVRRSLARDPRDRYSKAGTFAHDLLLATERGGATGVLAPPPPRPLRRERGWGIDGAVALLAVIAVLLGTLLVFAAFQGRPTPASPTASPARTAAVTGTPNVVGKDVNEAASALIAAGFRSPVPWEIDPAAKGTPCSVARQRPAAGASFQRGDTAQLFLVGGKDCGAKGQ